MRHVAIVGTRPPRKLRANTPQNWRIYAIIIADVERFCLAIDPHVDPILVSGGADGVDSKAEEYFGHMIIHRPDYAKWGPIIAPLERNALIVRDADEIHAWPSPWGTGTSDTIRRAQKAGKPLTVHEPWR